MDDVLNDMIKIRQAMTTAPWPARLIIARVMRELADEIEQPRVAWFRWDDRTKELVPRNEKALGMVRPEGQ